MGGSVALALKRAGLVKQVVGYSKSPSTTDRARKLGVIDVAAPSALLAISGADLVLIAVPVSASEAIFKTIRHGVSPQMLVMDVGSTKQDVIDAAERGLLDRAVRFVPAHPVAGKEVAGIEHADADLFVGRTVVLTPTRITLHSNVLRARQMWAGVGAKVVTMTAREHDSAFAAVSHLPHLLAFAFANGIAQQPEGARFLELAGPGFRDFTRIAGGDPSVWRDIFLSNRGQILAQAEVFRSALALLESTLSTGNPQALEALIVQANRTRTEWQSAPARITSGQA